MTNESFLSELCSTLVLIWKLEIGFVVWRVVVEKNQSKNGRGRLFGNVIAYFKLVCLGKFFGQPRYCLNRVSRMEGFMRYHLFSAFLCSLWPWNKLNDMKCLCILLLENLCVKMMDYSKTIGCFFV